MPRKQISKKQELFWNDIPNNDSIDDAKFEAACKSGELQEWKDNNYSELLDDRDSVAKAFFSSLEEGEADQAISILSSYLANKKYKAIKGQKIAKSTLYDAFGKDANPTLRTLAKILSSNREIASQSPLVSSVTTDIKK